MNIVLIIQARMGSTRLKGKVLLALDGKSVLAHVVERCQKVNNINHVIVATTESSEDDPIINECEKLNIPYVRGSEADVLGRYYKAAKQYHADIIVRVTSDCPLLDPSLCEKVVSTLVNDEDATYCSNDLERTYPRGLDVEAFRMRDLEDAFHNADSEHYREHVTPYFYENPDKYKLLSIRNEKDYSDYRWTLDTKEDWELIQAIYSYRREQEDCSWLSILELYKNYPELYHINSHIKQKTY